MLDFYRVAKMRELALRQKEIRQLVENEFLPCDA
jgi:hypothetical protein